MYIVRGGVLIHTVLLCIVGGGGGLRAVTHGFAYWPLASQHALHTFNTAHYT